MFKVLVVSQDQSYLKLEKYFNLENIQFDFAYAEESCKSLGNLDKQVLVTDQLVQKINADSEVKHIQWLLDCLKKDLQNKDTNSTALLRNLKNDLICSFKLHDVLSIKTDNKLKKTIVTLKDSIQKYDYILIEKSEVLIQFKDIFKNFYKINFSGNTYFSGFEFQLDQDVNPFVESFWWLDNHNNETLIDNLYFIQVVGLKITIWGLFDNLTPLSGNLKNEISIHNFIKDRLKNKLQQKMTYLNLKLIDSANAKSTLKLSLDIECKITKKDYLGVIPTYNFIPELEMDKDLSTHLLKIQKRLKSRKTTNDMNTESLT